jgi:hypothetical protein
MDFLGYVTLGLYIVFEIGLHSFLNDHFASSATVLLLSVISGVLAGRAIGTVVQIHRVYTESEAGQGA